MNIRNNLFCISLAVALVATGGALFAATHETGRARIIPWSGYWWPMKEARIVGPLSRYDAITGRQAVAWERRENLSREDIRDWWGLCHAWAASALLEPEPRVTVVHTTPEQPVELEVGDQKGLLAVCHTNDVANSYGDRFGDEEGSEDPHDLAPDVLWRLLHFYVKQQGMPLILDVEAGEEVWNYPVYEYHLEFSPAGSAGKQSAHLTLFMADNLVPPDHVGTKVRKLTYRFTFALHEGSVVMGSGRWTGPSRDNHPDFAWYPYIARGDNPEVDYGTVKRLLQGGSPTTPPETGDQPSLANRPPPAADPGASDTGTSEISNGGSASTLAGDPATSQPGHSPPPDEISQTGADDGAAALPLTPSDAVMLSPLELVAAVANRSPTFGLDVTVDRYDGGRYKVGDTFSVRGSSEKAGHLYLLHVDSRGELTLLFPQPGQDNRIAAKKPFLVPREADRFAFRALNPVGVNRVKAIVTEKPLQLTGLIPSSARELPGKGIRQAGIRQCFRWHPSQKQYLQLLLRAYQSGKTPSKNELGDVDLPRLLGPYSMDEVAFYVDTPQSPGR